MQIFKEFELEIFSALIKVMIQLRISLKLDLSANYSIAIFFKFCLRNRIRSVQKNEKVFERNYKTVEDK